MKQCPSPSQKEEENLGNRNKIRSSHRILQRCFNDIASSQVRWGQNSSLLKDKCSSTVGHSCAFENSPEYNAILYMQCSASIVSSTRPSFQGRATGAAKASNWIFWSAGNLSRLATPCYSSVTRTVLHLIYLIGSKLKHFKELHKKTGIPYSEMVSVSTTLRLLSSIIEYDGQSCFLMMSVVTRK